MCRKMFIILSFMILILSGCQHQPTYAEVLNAREMPKTKEGTQQECSYIREEIARMHSISQQASMTPCNPQYGLCIGPIMMAKANNNIALLENRAAIVQCDAAFSTVKVINNNSNNTIKECIAACKENTNRSSLKCFDACNK